MTRRVFATAMCLALSLSCGVADPPPVSGIDRAGFDPSVRPQDDFFGAVNGGWLATTEIPADQTGWGPFDILRRESDANQRAIIEELAAVTTHAAGTDEQRIGDFFRAYMDTDRLEELGATPVQAVLQQIRDAGSAAELMALGAEWGREGLNTPVGVGVIPDLGDSTRYMTYLIQAGLTLPDRDYYLRDGEQFEAIRLAMPGYAATLFELGGVDDAQARGAAVLALETRIAEHHWPAEQTRNVQALYNLHDVSDLGEVTAEIDWTSYLTAAGLASQSEVVVAMPSYVAGLGTLLGEASLDDWKSYWSFRVLHDSATLLSDAFVQARFEFVGRLVNGLEEQQPRWRRGTQLINALMGEAVGKVYVERHFPPEAKARMEVLVGNLIDAFGDAIDGLDWMTEETKARAQEKRLKFTTKIGYPDEWRDYSALAIAGDDLVGNVRRATAFEYDRNLAKLSGPIDRGEWGMTPQTVNAYHNPTMNEIVFPAAILQPPFFFLDADDAVNYGAIGSGIGHEIGHAFDDQGRRFDGDGNLRDWWSDEDARGFEASAAQLVEQYSAYEPLDGLHVNGQLTLGENIGDLTGLVIAYSAYLKSLDGEEPPVIDGLTGPQRFFMGWAQVWRAKYRDEALRQRLVSDPHSPPRARTNGPLGHIPAFYEAFDVQEGDRMWIPPDRRVKIW